MNVIEHLQPTKIVELNFFGIDVSLYNSVLTLWLGVFLVLAFFILTSRKAKLIPTPGQSIAECLVDFIRQQMLSPLGKEGEVWLPFLLSLFCLILISNLLGLVPGLLPPTSNINVTGTLAIIVFLLVNTLSIIKHGFLGYLKSFIPPGVPLFLVPLLFPIELMGQVARPFSLAVRLFANMFAGHAIILVFLSFIFLFKSYLILPLPILGDVAISAFEIFVSFIQAFIFTYLSSSYIIGALKAEH